MDEFIQKFKDASEKTVEILIQADKLKQEGKLAEALEEWRKILKFATRLHLGYVSHQIEWAESEIANQQEAAPGKSELEVEREMITLIEKANKYEKEGLYLDAINTLEKASAMVGHSGGLESKIKRLKKKLKEINPAGGGAGGASSDPLQDLEESLTELTKEASQTMAEEEEKKAGLDDLFDDVTAAQEQQEAAAQETKKGLDDLFAGTEGGGGGTGGGDDKKDGLEDLFKE